MPNATEYMASTLGMQHQHHNAYSTRRQEMVGLDGLEPTTSVLSGPRSNRLSYRPTVYVRGVCCLSIISISRVLDKVMSRQYQGYRI